MYEGSLSAHSSQEPAAFTLHTLKIRSESSSQTHLLGVHLGELLRGGELLLLDGQLGAGKTTFTQGLAQGLGITDTITSPTFTLLKQYSGQFRPLRGGRGSEKGPALYHFDLYRLDQPEEIIDLGFEDYFYDSTGVCVVEWADKADGLWIPETLRIAMQVRNETQRECVFSATGSYYIELLHHFQKNIHATTRA